MELRVDGASALEVTYVLLGGVGCTKEDNADGVNDEFGPASEACNLVPISACGTRGRLPSI